MLDGASKQTNKQQVDIVNLSHPIKGVQIYSLTNQGVCFSPVNLFKLKILATNNEIVCQIDGCI